MTTELADLFMRFVAGDSAEELKAVELVSPLQLEECCRRLQARMDGTMFGTHLSLPVVGRIKEGDTAGTRRLSCSWNPVIYMRRQRNSFRTRLLAELIDQLGKRASSVAFPCIPS
jgi:hypothetical protein